MVRKMRSSLTYANVMSSIAVFMAMGGVAWAAALPKNSVGTAQLKSNSVTSAKIKTGQVASSDIKDKAINGVDVRDNTISGDDVNEGSLGQVPSAAAADSATVAGSAQPAAFATVDGATGTISDAKGITQANIARVNTGIYCINGMPFAVKGASVITQFTGTAGSTAQFSKGPTGNCPNGAQVLTYTSAGAPADQVFYLMVWG
jgi:hypothetical protein